MDAEPVPLLDVQAASSPASATYNVSVEYNAGQLTVMVDGQPIASAHDDRLPPGLTGLALLGEGDPIFRHLMVEDLR